MQNSDALKGIADAITSTPTTESIFQGNIVDANKIQNERQIADKIRGGMANTVASLGLLGAGTPYGN